jgi:hypothetical protein
VVERSCVDNRCSYTHCYWRLILDKMEIGRGHLGRPVKHSEGKNRESVVVIMRFLCRLRTKGLVPVSKY